MVWGPQRHVANKAPHDSFVHPRAGRKSIPEKTRAWGCSDDEDRAELVEGYIDERRLEAGIDLRLVV